MIDLDYYIMLMLFLFWLATSMSTANSGLHSRVMSYRQIIVLIYACRSDIISTDNSFMHVGMMSFCRQVVYKLMSCCVF